jgi:hypothetical protein
VKWSEFEGGDFERVPGDKARRYRLKSDPKQVISRRQFDQHYGKARAYGTLEAKAKHKASEPGALLRPARGRKDARKLTGTEREQEIQRRRVAAKEKAIDAALARQQSKKLRYPHKITLRTFKPKMQTRGFEVPVDTQAIDSVRASAKASGFIFGYIVGLILIDMRSGAKLTPTLFALRDIAKPFTERDMDNAVRMAQEKHTYTEWAGMWMKLRLTKAAAKRNGKKFKE